jgi:catechol 2,3-dioxygenase-like lactoylglutathione lyase family enzyme
VNVWYRVSDLDAACEFYVTTLGFELVFRDDEHRWAGLAAGGAELSLSEERAGDPDIVFTLDVPDVVAEADRLRAAGVEVGTALEIPGGLRIVDVFDPDGNRLQLAEVI